MLPLVIGGPFSVFFLLLHPCATHLQNLLLGQGFPLWDLRNPFRFSWCLCAFIPFLFLTPILSFALSMEEIRC
ncbi:MAG: hypothetical protein KAI38_03575, partial [Candidatus Latescibacteria bacterium]|nr:hypothetical protein [Candidatus Latescibacterota bacterium]